MKTVVMRVVLAMWTLIMVGTVSTWLSGCGGDVNRPAPMPDADGDADSDADADDPLPDAGTDEADAALTLSERYTAAQTACNACLGSDACTVADTQVARATLEAKCCEDISLEFDECVAFDAACSAVPVRCVVPDAGPAS